MSPLPGAIATKPGSCTKPLPGIIPAIVDHARQAGRQEPGRLAGDDAAVARHAARHLGRRRPLQGSVLEQSARQVSGRRQCPLRRRRLLLDHGPHRRRAQCFRPSAEHDRNRKRAGVASERGRGRRGRPAGRTQGRSGGRVRHAHEAASRTTRCAKSSRSTSATRSARWPSRTTSASPAPCPKPAAAKSCVDCCATSPPAKKPSATPRRWKITACWPNSGGMRNSAADCRHWLPEAAVSDSSQPADHLACLAARLRPRAQRIACAARALSRSCRSCC